MEKDKIPCGPIFNIKDAVGDPQVKSRNMIVNTFHKVVGDLKQQVIQSKCLLIKMK